MDFKDRMEQMKRDMERHRQEINDRINKYRHLSSDEETIIPVAPEPNPDVTKQSNPLLHHEGLEDESETKLGMFERIYPTYSINYKPVTFESFGYSDIDFSPLINLLAGIVEIELYASLRYMFQSLLKESTYGTYISLITENKSCLSRHLGDTDRFISQLRIIKRMRNSANHKGVVTDRIFYKFFKNCYVPFFNETVPYLIRLKKRYQNNKHMHETDTCHAAMASCKSFEEYRKMLDSLFSVLVIPVKPEKDNNNLCIIWTNTRKLAVKNCTEERSDYQDVLRMFFNGINISGIQYVLFDAADPKFEKYIYNDDSWQAHHTMLQRFKDGVLSAIGIKHTVPLFIIGGDDVIPMPKVSNPVSHSVYALSGKVLENMIDVDWLYSFPKKCVNIDDAGCISVNDLSLATPSFFVSRLPIESGLAETDIIEDLNRYFSKTAPYLESGIQVKKVGAVAMETCRMLMENTIKGFPQCDLRQFDENYKFKSSFTSPLIKLDDDEIHTSVMNDYKTVIRDCDMVTFDLHGSPSPNSPSYMGESSGDEKIYPTAFSPDLLNGSKVKIMVPISCWGARFIGYRRDNSMMLHSLHNTGVVLFMGSCRTTYGSNDERGAELRYGSWIMRLFMQNLLKGIPAGEALYRAKTEYLTKYSEGKVHDFLTVQQFNLFGDPMLRVDPCISFDRTENSSDGLILPDFTWNDYSYREKSIYEMPFEPMSVLDRVRSLVDTNINDIKNRINDLLYRQYNIQPENLQRIARFVTGNGNKGLRFVYSSKGMCPATVMAYSDEDGNLTDIVYTF